MSNETRDPERIWLEPGVGAPETGRLWCDTDVWAGDPDYEEDGPSTEYVRADLARLDAADPLRAMWGEVVDALERERKAICEVAEDLLASDDDGNAASLYMIAGAIRDIRARAIDATNQGGDDGR